MATEARGRRPPQRCTPCGRYPQPLHDQCPRSQATWHDSATSWAVSCVQVPAQAQCHPVERLSAWCASATLRGSCAPGALHHTCWASRPSNRCCGMKQSPGRMPLENASSWQQQQVLYADSHPHDQHNYQLFHAAQQEGPGASLFGLAAAPQGLTNRSKLTAFHSLR